MRRNGGEIRMRKLGSLLDGYLYDYLKRVVGL